MLPRIADRPRTALADTADQMLIESSPMPLVQHCYRTYAFGAALLEQQTRAYDGELLFVAAALHDLGLTEDWDDGVNPFEVRGAQVAFEALLEHGTHPERAALVRDAIALHLEVSTKNDPRPEVVGITIGSAADVLGLGLGKLPPQLVAQVLDLHPRHDFKTYITRAIHSQVEQKPTSRIAQHTRELPFIELIAAAPYDS